MVGTYTFIDTPRLIPVDVVAEESLAGAAIVSDDDAHHIATVVGPNEFHDPRCWAIIAAASDLPGHLNDDGLDWCDWDSDLAMLTHGCARRTQAIAEATGIEISWLRQLVERRSGEQTERLVDRLFHAHEKRRLNQAHLDALIDNGVDVRMLTNFDAWMDATRTHVLQATHAVRDAVFGDASDDVMADALGRLGALFGIPAADIATALAPPGADDGR